MNKTLDYTKAVTKYNPWGDLQDRIQYSSEYTYYGGEKPIVGDVTQYHNNVNSRVEDLFASVKYEPSNFDGLLKGDKYEVEEVLVFNSCSWLKLKGYNFYHAPGRFKLVSRRPLSFFQKVRNWLSSINIFK